MGTKNSDGTVTRTQTSGRPSGGGTPITKAPLAKPLSGGGGPRVAKTATGGVVDRKQSNRV